MEWSTGDGASEVATKSVVIAAEHVEAVAEAIATAATGENCKASAGFLADVSSVAAGPVPAAATPAPSAATPAGAKGVWA